MALDNTKHDVELNGISHRIKGYQKSEAPAFIPRVGGGAQSESEFNVLLAKTLRGMAGGILQREWKDDTSVFGAEGLFPIYDDGVAYPVDGFVDPSGTTGLIGKSQLTSYVVTKDYVYIAYQSYNTPTNYVKRIDANGTQTAITLPANLSNGARRITGMTFWSNQIWFGTDDGGTQCYLDYASTTALEITGGGGYYQMVVLKGSLYGTNAPTNSAIYKWSGSTAARSFTLVGDTGQTTVDTTARLINYNNRIFLLRKDGMYAYDGVTLVTLEDATSNWNILNYSLACALKGYLYYFMPDGLFRFNGSLIEKLYDMSEIGTPVDMCTGKNRLWILYSNSGYSASVSRYDKAMGYNYSSSDNLQGRVAVFNGKSLYTYGRTSTFIKNPALIDFSGQDEAARIFWFGNKTWVTLNHSKAGSYHTCSTNETALTGTKAWSLVSSIHDGDFPMIDKNVESVELVFDGNVPANEAIVVEYRTAGFDGATGWAAFGTISSQTETKRQTWKTNAAGIAYKKIQFRLTGTTNVSYGIAKFIVRYTLNPDFKWQWQFTVLAYGDKDTEPLLLSDGTNDTQTVAALRGNMYAARQSDVPVKFVDIDQLDLNGAITSGVLSVVLNTTSLLKGEEGFIQIDNEVIYWYVKTSTTLTVVRGQLGTIAASHVDNSKVFIVYRTLINQIQNERIELEPNSVDLIEDKSRASEITILLREV